MRNKLYKISTAILAFAIAFTFSCSDDKDDGGGGSSSSVGGSDQLSPCEQGIVTIGNQVWQKCNLNVEPIGTDVATNAKCYANQLSNCAIYGRLYDWATAMALPSSCNKSFCSGQIDSPHRGLCPIGWHIPSKAEWNTLASYIENNKNCSSCDAKHLKAQRGWNSCSVSGGSYFCLDSYGFAALPGGDGGRYIGIYGFWWSTSEDDKEREDAYFRRMINSGEYVQWDAHDKSNLFSVRCIKD